MTLARLRPVARSGSPSYALVALTTRSMHSWTRFCPSSTLLATSTATRISWMATKGDGFLIDNGGQTLSNIGTHYTFHS